MGLGGADVVLYDKTNMTSQHGQPAAQILPCPSEDCKFQLVLDFGCSGEGGGGKGLGLFSIIKQI